MKKVLRRPSIRVDSCKRPDKVTITGEVEQRLIAWPAASRREDTGVGPCLLADRLVELGYVARASRETIRQALKKRSQAVAGENVVHYRPKPMPTLCITWRMRCRFTNCPTIDAIPSSVWTKPANN